MKSKGRTAWLITWEGPEFEDMGRCKVVIILHHQHRGYSIAALMAVLYQAEYPHTLDEKLDYISKGGRGNFFREAYRDINPEYYHGVFPKIYLRARQVKNLRCEVSPKSVFESTLYWTELPKFIPNPKYGAEGPPMEKWDDACKQVTEEKECSYTYSTRPSVDGELKRGANTKAAAIKPPARTKHKTQ